MRIEKLRKAKADYLNFVTTVLTELKKMILV
jgi:hypothetical protein